MIIRKIRAGSAVFFRIATRDMTDPLLQLSNPSGGVKLTLRMPDGTLAVNDLAMTNESTGVYIYTHQTSSTNPLGVWLMSYKVTTSAIVITPEKDAFELVP